MVKKLVILISLCLICHLLPAQKTQERDTLDPKKIKVDYAERGILQKDPTLGDTQKLIGQVELRHDSIYMYCDSAVLHNNLLTAGGHVIIQDKDSIVVFGNVLHYDGNTKRANITDSVILIQGQRALYTARLDYDLERKVAAYQQGGLLVNQDMELSSLTGFYFVDEEKAIFKHDVRVKHPEFKAVADSLIYLGKEDAIRFISPSRILINEGELYCEDGYYSLTDSKGVFSKNAKYDSKGRVGQADHIYYDRSLKRIVMVGNAIFSEQDKRIKGDTIYYFEETGNSHIIGHAFYKTAQSELVADEINYNGRTKRITTGGKTNIIDGTSRIEADEVTYNDVTGLAHAAGQVLWQDSSRGTTIIADQADYRKSDQYVKAYGSTRPLLMRKMDGGDTLYICADTLYSYQVPKTDSAVESLDSQRIILAYTDVKVFKTDFQVICDSLSYQQSDSSFRFYNSPVMWSDTTQLSADTIVAFMRGNDLSHMVLKKNGFIISSQDHMYYDQIKGRDLNADFLDGRLHRVFVTGNAESHYYVLDDENAYIGLNTSICSKIAVHFGTRNKILTIDFLDNPTFKFIPIQQITDQPPTLKGFKWDQRLRPKSLSDIRISSQRPIKIISDTSAIKGSANKKKTSQPMESGSVRKVNLSKSKLKTAKNP